MPSSRARSAACARLPTGATVGPEAITRRSSPGTSDRISAVTGARSFALARHENAALFFPRIRAADPYFENRLESFAPCGAVAGVFARTDATRGIWKAPAGIEAQLSGVAELGVPLTDAENGDLNPLGVNCLRAFPTIGRVVWGARTAVIAIVVSFIAARVIIKKNPNYIE